MEEKSILKLIDEKNQLSEKQKNMIEKGKTEKRKLDETEKKEFDEINIRKKEIDDEIKKIEEENKRLINNNNKTIKTEKRMEKFSLIKTINDIANNRSLNEVSLEIIRRGKEQMIQAGLNSAGQIQLPVNQRSISATGVGQGAEVVDLDVLNILSPLYANLTLTAAGAQTLNGLSGNIQIPLYSGSNVAWESENMQAPDGAGVFSKVMLNPHRLTAILDVSKQFLAQQTVDAEAMLTNDILMAISEKLEATVLGNASGANQPQGFFANSSNYVTIPASGLSYSNIVALEALLENKNVKNYSFIVHPKTKATLKATAKNLAQMIYEDNMIDGVKTFTTANVYPNGLILGDFSDFVIGQWSSVDITVDPYSQANLGNVRLVVNAYFDAKARRDSFVAAVIA
jgi:HK97 family phage major capsid protein